MRFVKTHIRFARRGFRARGNSLSGETVLVVIGCAAGLSTIAGFAITAATVFVRARSVDVRINDIVATVNEHAVHIDYLRVGQLLTARLIERLERQFDAHQQSAGHGSGPGSRG